MTQQPQASDRPNPTFLSIPGEMAQRIADFDWSRTALGPLDAWPQVLKTVVSLILHSPIPVVTLWREDGVMIYNDAYAAFSGNRHPALLGSKVREGWPEVASFNDNVMKVGLSGGTLSYRDQVLTLNRNSNPEQVWLNLDYSPVLDENGDPLGVFCTVVETTAKVRAQRRLSGEGERLRLMFEQAPGFIAVLRGPDHVVELANDAYLTLIGHRDVLNRPLRDALPELADQGFLTMLDDLLTHGRPHNDTSRPVVLHRGPNVTPETRYVDVGYQPLRDEQGEIFGIFLQGIDVTARVSAEQALRGSEARFRTLAQAMPGHVWMYAPEDDEYWFNDRFYTYVGEVRENGTNFDWTRIAHPDDLPIIQERWTAALKSGEPYQIEARIRQWDGQFRWHLCRASAVYGSSGELQVWVGANTDIEEQKVSERALATLNESLEKEVTRRTADRDRMWRLSTDVMLVADFHATIIAVNPAWTTLTGWEQSELVGHSFMSFVHPDDHGATIDEVAHLESGARTLRFENRYRRKDGSYCALSWTAVPEDGMIHAVGRDVTGDREAAAALRRTEVALQQAQKMETVGKLTGGIAHDFNNLLQVIAGNLQLLARDVAGNERAERRVNNALGGVSRGAKLASHLLAFGRRQVLEPRVLNVGRFLSGMDDMMRRTIGEAIDIELVSAGGLWNTLVDPAQLENAVLNLVINARDAMEGHGKLTVEVGNAYLDEAYAADHADVAKGQYVMIGVTDTGTGIPADVLSQVFEPFFSTKPEGKGTGLGLSMVYGFVKQSGGHVKIYSEVGFGTSVKLYLPRVQQQEDAIAPAEAPPVRGGSETILVAEDDDQVRATVVDTLTELGYTVLRARDATTALNIIESGVAIDMLFTDVVMPGPMRSPELARRAKEIIPDLAVLFTSGYTENAIVHGGRLDQGVELIGKPYTREALARRIRHMLANKEQRLLLRSALAASESASRPGLPGARILLVEDDDLIRVTTAELLREIGYIVLDVGDGEEACRLLEHERIDVLLTDLGLPGMSGEALVHHATSTQPQLSIIIATGNADGGTFPPGVAVLRKPYDSGSLSAALQQLPAREPSAD